ncbi:adenylate/guanylate cyclase domain-containing protein [Tumidithrix elongata RA019]|uniref:Adenylate/guanylate cyclase domain-containing protein n=1 Tax=Tumidithrix elongata BACA0141 TaxID=2716417 RepID=A0AAW9PYC2_9CYAN|nr:adenylate/guanylate cyclase domain-containing protein [Tumidithrix elongata RA019]
MPQIYCLPDDQIVEATKGDSVLYAVLAFGVPHIFACGGNARCSTCRIRILEGLENCNPRNALEEELADKLGFPTDVRLACQTKVVGDIKVHRLVLDSEDIDTVENQLSVGSIGEEKQIAVLFADIRGFTKFAEATLPYDVIYVLNSYFSRMNKVILRHGGVINSYMGDGLMALFVSGEPELAAEMAVRAGLEMLEAMASLNTHIDVLASHPLKIGIGINFGWVVLGEVGASSNKVMTAIGDTVNLASRIESANKKAGTELLVSESVYNLVKENAIACSSHQVEIAGKSGKYTLYEISGITGERSFQRPRKRTTLFSKILNWFYRLGRSLQKAFRRL